MPSYHPRIDMVLLIKALDWRSGFCLSSISSPDDVIGNVIGLRILKSAEFLKGHCHERKQDGHGPSVGYDFFPPGFHDRIDDIGR